MILNGKTPPTEDYVFKALPTKRLRLLEGWAMVMRAPGYVWQPKTTDEIREVLALARASGRSVAPRGAGNSYNDAALNAEGIVLDLSHMRHVLAWDAESGVIAVEPGVTVRDLWRTMLPDGWWPVVVPGTMGPTIGGCAAMNVHGKNAWKAGPIGEYIRAFDLLFPSGKLRTVTPESDPELFHAAIGGLGMLGVITRIELQTRRVPSGVLSVRQRAARSLAEMFAIFAEEAEAADYMVGWLDGFAAGESLGRGLVECANFTDQGDPRFLQPASQDLPSRIAGVIPRGELWRGMRYVFTDPAMRLANAAQFTKGSLSSRPHLVPHAQFHFFHDYVPNWKRAWLPGGLRQFQVFVPASDARAVFAELLERSQQADIYPYLCVFKQHRADDFHLSYQVDGFSLSLDYRVTARNASRLDKLLNSMRAPVLSAKGRFYLAKDDAIHRYDYARSMGEDTVKHFVAIKRACDPDEILQSDLYRRIHLLDDDEDE
jgi:decaprenylphospho-beta-D-ribofuranose 2-oxidase